jgi:HlyD family secretion protein
MPVIFRSFSFYLALVGIGATVFLTNKQALPPPVPIHLIKPAVNPYERTIAASGIIESIDKNIEIGAPQAGMVKDVYIKAGDNVEEGQHLFFLDDRELQAQLLVQKANAMVLTTYLNRCKDQLKRFELIDDKRAISQEEMLNRWHAVAIAQAELEFAEAQIQQTMTLINRLIVCAPKNGMILQNNIRVGEFVSAGTQASLILGNVDHLQVRVDIDEQNASQIVAGAAAVAFPKNLTTYEIALKFDRIEPYVIPKRSLSGASDERVDTRVLQVIYTFDKSDFFPLYVGQQMDVFIKQEPSQEIAINAL